MAGPFHAGKGPAASLRGARHQPLVQRRVDLLPLREPAVLLLRIEQLTVQCDLEDAATTGDQQQAAG